MSRERSSVNGVREIRGTKVNHTIILARDVIERGMPSLDPCSDCHTVDRVLQYGIPSTNRVRCEPNLNDPKKTSIEAGGRTTEGLCNLANALLHHAQVDPGDESGD